MKKSTLLSGVAILAGVAVAVILLASRKDLSPRAVKRPTLDSLINVHGSPEQGLRVCGKTFRRVRGAPPHFIAVTNTALMLFAYEPFEGTRMLVVCNTNNCSFREIPLGNSVFGNQIGYWGPTKGQMGDIVESVSSSRLSLLAKGFRYVERSELNLSNYTIRITEVQTDVRPPIALDPRTNR